MLTDRQSFSFLFNLHSFEQELSTNLLFIPQKRNLINIITTMNKLKDTFITM